MAEFINTSEQTVESTGNVLFTSETVCCKKCIQHRAGSGLVTLKGLTNQNSARFLIDFSGNIAIPTGGAVGEISLSVAINGETLGTGVMRSVPAAVNNYNNVSTSTYITVPQGCCTTIAVENTSGQAILVEGASLIVTRVA